MSEVVHTCFISESSTSPMHMPMHIPVICNENCQNVKVDEIQTLDDEDKQVHKEDISVTSYLNEMTSSNLYEDMLVTLPADDEEIFYSDEDDFFIEFNDNSEIEYTSQRSIRLLDPEDISNIDIQNYDDTSKQYEEADQQEQVSPAEDELSSPVNSEPDSVCASAIQTEDTFQGNYLKKPFYNILFNIHNVYL